MNIFELTFKMFDLLLTWSSLVFDFLFSQVSIGFQGFEILGTTILKFSIDIIPFFAIGGPVAITLLLLHLGKEFIPVA